MEKDQGIPGRLETLWQLLANLPENLPQPEQTQYPFHPSENFFLDAEEVEDNGKVRALNRLLENTYGFQSCSQGDGIIPIFEHGPSICAVANILEIFVLKFPSDAVLTKWVDDLIAAAKKVSQITEKV